MKLELERKAIPASLAPKGLNLAASWYIALRSDALAKKPKALELFGRLLVAWRDGQGRPAIMSRHCPHMGASLALGKVADGCLQCPFHHWRFAASGRCVQIPGVERIPAIAHQTAYPIEERYGYIWVWYGSSTPMFPLPEFPALETDRRSYLAYRFADATPATARQVLENAYDYYHFITLHGLNVAESLQFTVLSDQQACRDNGPPIATEAWSGALLECPKLLLPRILRVLGVKGMKFSLLVDGWPGGQRLTFFVDDQVIAKEFLGVTPIAEHRTIQQGWAMVKKTGNLWKDGLYYLLYRLEHRAGTKQDLSIYKTANAEQPGIPVKYDRGVLKFREYYQRWVERAAPPTQSRSP
jgi:nitrite reductase/ring-hydroxylating ferredoxin subunit